MGGGAMDTIDARWRRQRQQQRRDGVVMRNDRDGRRRTMSKGRGDTAIKKMTIKKRRAGASCSLEMMADVMASALR